MIIINTFIIMKNLFAALYLGEETSTWSFLMADFMRVAMVSHFGRHEIHMFLWSQARTFKILGSPEEIFFSW